MIALGIQGGEPLLHMLLENPESGSYTAPLALPQYGSFVTETSDDVQPIDTGYSSGEATVTAESSLIRSRSRLTPSPRSGSLRRRTAATQDCKKHVHEDTVARPGSSVTASGNCKPFPTMRTQPSGYVTVGAKSRDATVCGEVPALPTWLPLDRRHARTSCQKPLRSWNRSSALPESPASSAPSSRAKHGLVRSYSFESAAEELYASSAHHLTTGAYLSMESYSNSDLKRYAREKEGSSAQHPTLVTSDEPGKKFLDTPRHLRIPARRLSEGSSCGSQNGLRPQLSRNFSSTNSVTSYWSRLSANDTDGASSNPDIDDGFPRDGRPYTRLKYGGKLSGKSVYSSGGPASPLSEDGSRLSDANTDIFYGPQRSLEQLKPLMLSALLFGLRLLAVVPATVGSLALVWPILQGNVRDAAGLANALMALPWAVLTGIFCFELTSGLSQRWLLHYALAPTLLRLVSLQSLCWPCTFLTLRYIGSIDILLGWIVVATTTACSRSVQIWVTSNVPDQLPPRLLQTEKTAGSLAETTIDTKKLPPLSASNARQRIWDWQEIGQVVWIRVAILYGVTTWFLLGIRHCF